MPIAYPSGRLALMILKLRWAGNRSIKIKKIIVDVRRLVSPSGSMWSKSRNRKK